MAIQADFRDRLTAKLRELQETLDGCPQAPRPGTYQGNTFTTVGNRAVWYYGDPPNIMCGQDNCYQTVWQDDDQYKVVTDACGSTDGYQITLAKTNAKSYDHRDRLTATLGELKALILRCPDAPRPGSYVGNLGAKIGNHVMWFNGDGRNERCGKDHCRQTTLRTGDKYKELPDKCEDGSQLVSITLV